MRKRLLLCGTPRRRLWTSAALLAVGALAIGLAFWWQAPESRAVVNAPLRPIASPVSGHIETALPPAGETIGPGFEIVVRDPRHPSGSAAEITQRIARVDHERLRLQAEISANEAAMRRRARMDRVDSRPRNDSLAERVQRARTTVQKRDWEAAQAHADLLWLRTLKNEGRKGADGKPITAMDLNEAQLRLSEAETQMHAERGKLSALEYAHRATLNGQLGSDARPDRIQPEGRTAQLERELAASRTRQQQLGELRSSLSGDLRWLRDTQTAEARAHIPVPAGRVWRRAEAGTAIEAGTELGAIADCERTMITATLSPRRYRQLEVGMPARIELDGDGDSPQVLYGRVTDLDPARPRPGEPLALPLASEPGSPAHGVIVALAQPTRLSCRIGAPAKLDFSARYAAELGET